MSWAVWCLLSNFTKQKVHSLDDIEYKSIVCTFSLDEGEQAALALMRYEADAIFLTDHIRTDLLSSIIDQVKLEMGLL